ncbi:MAG TPA: hypothetical protein VKT77_08395 [Chthonomonadaceae bacterium]|nr:hypothetical protein [Chthonomonadaceae bacterium]
MPKTASVIDDPAAKPKLTLSNAEGERATEPDRPTVFSSIKQTAVALSTAARSQAARRARVAPGALAAEVAAAERTDLAVQRANAEQARRVAEATRAALDSLVRHTLHPCLAVNESGGVVRWNGAIAAWTGIEEATALGLSVGDLFAPDAAGALLEACGAVREAELERSEPDADPVFVIDGAFALRSGATAARVALVPLCLIPHVVEEVLLLVTPV